MITADDIKKYQNIKYYYTPKGIIYTTESDATRKWHKRSSL